MADKKRIAYLQKKVDKLNIDPEIHRNKFEQQAGYRGNGIYEWCGEFTTDLQELWLMGVLIIEGVSYKSE